MKKDFSPEERLLRLIKGSKKKDAPKDEESAPKIHPSESMPQVNRMPAYRKESGPMRAKAISISLPLKLKKLNTRTLNPILIIMLIFLLSYLMYDVIYTTYYEKEEPGIFAEVEKRVPEVEGEDILEIKPYSFYSSSIEGRNIFMPQQVEIEPVFTGPSLAEITAGLSLIGIIAGDKPQAIIEDKKAGKSHFLYEGGTVGQAKVVEILEDRVVMDYQGQRFELVL